MQALRFHGQKDLRLEEVPIPKCEKGQVKIKPAYVGICGTDLHEYLDGAHIIPSVPHPITNESVPVTLGHEFSGTIEEVGEGVTDIAIGTRVAVQPIIYDGTCASCKEGYINCCDRNGFVGLSGWGGGLSEHVVVPRHSAIPVPDDVSLEVAALVEPLAVAWHAVNLSAFESNQSVLILGGGPIGLAVVQALVARNATKIILSEPSRARAEFARRLGAHHILNPFAEDIPSKVRELTGADSEGKGGGVNIVYDAAGVQKGLEQAARCIRARGLLVNIAVWKDTATIVPNIFAFREIRYMGIATYVEGDFKAVIDAISSGKIKEPEMMITRIIDNMRDIEEKGFKALIEDKDNQVKILVKVH